MKKQNGGSKAGMVIIAAIVIVICAIFVVKTQKLSAALDVKRAELAHVNAQIDAAQEETKDIQNEIKYRETDDYIEDQARENLGLRYPDEIILVPRDGSKE